MGLGVIEGMTRIELQQLKKIGQKLCSYRESPAALYHPVVVRYHCLLVLIEPWIRTNDHFDLKYKNYKWGVASNWASRK